MEDEISAPLSYSQERFWLLHQLDPGNAYYHECAPIRILGSLNTQLLESILSEVIRRHQVLRSKFEYRQGFPTQRLQSLHAFEFPLVDLSGLPAQERNRTLQELALKFVQHPFDLEASIPVRISLLRCHEHEHFLLLTLHHIVSDTWSLGVMLSELQVLYKAWQEGVPSPLPELTFQYADVARSEREDVRSRVLARDLGYWQEQLAGVSTSLNLPTDRPRPRSPSTRGARESFALSGSLSASVRSLARSNGATLFMTLLAAFKVLLHRYCDVTEVVVGSPVANRAHKKTEAMIGPFLNVLLMRSDLSSDPSFRELIARVKSTCVGAYSHHELPLQMVIRQTPELHGSQSHPFEAMFVLQNAPLPELRLGDLELRVMDLDKQSVAFDLDMQVWEGAQELHGWLHYRTDLFDGATIRRLLSNFEVLLQGAVDDPDCSISCLPLLSPEEEHLQRVQWNDTLIDLPEDQTVHELFAMQARASPDAAAVLFEDSVVSYGELNRRANRLARHLRSYGVSPDVVVGVCMERSVDLIVALLAVLKAGGAYLPLDPTYPPERLAFMVQDARPSCVLGDRKRDDLPFEVEAFSELVIDELADTDTCCGVRAENLAYIIYTSGSTGTSKGVAVDHRAIVNRLTWMQRAYRLKKSDRVMQKTPFTFDVSVWEFFWPLSTGAGLVVAKPNGHWDSEYLVDTVRRHRVTTIHFVPSMLGAFLRTRSVAACSSLQRVICSGEELSKELETEFFDRLPTPLHNLYGPTEAAVDVTSWRCDRSGSFVPIGRPIANTQVYVLDRRMQIVPAGIRGELYIGGIQVARGYLQRPDLTADRFVPDAFADRPGWRLYRTGDAVSAAADGILRFRGRLDRQIKWHGIRVELCEIEAELERNSVIQQAIVDLVALERKNPQLLAFVLEPTGHAASPAELKHFLRRRLPEALIPTSIIVLRQFPLLPNGKVDREALLVDALNEGIGKDSAVALDAPPKTKLQQQILDIWRALFDRPQIGIDDNFFDLGGHSMLAVQFVNEMYRQNGVDIPVRLLFDLPTIAGLSETVETARWIASGQRSAPGTEGVECEI
jgi:amino acid adenylation domain-containing protein